MTNKSWKRQELESVAEIGSSIIESSIIEWFEVEKGRVLWHLRTIRNLNRSLIRHNRQM